MFDVYKNKKRPSERIATMPGAGLPSHVGAKEWTLMSGGTSQVIDDMEEDIDVRGFCFFELS